MDDQDTATQEPPEVERSSLVYCPGPLRISRQRRMLLPSLNLITSLIQLHSGPEYLPRRSDGPSQMAWQAWGREMVELVQDKNNLVSSTSPFLGPTNDRKFARLPKINTPRHSGAAQLHRCAAAIRVA